MLKSRQLTAAEVNQPILIVMLMSVIQQFSGMSVLRAYVVKIFDNIFDDDDLQRHLIIELNGELPKTWCQ